MAGTEVNGNTSRRISPTQAVKLVFSSDPDRSIHDAARDVTEWMYRNKCRLWCDGNLLSVDYITTSLVVVARLEAHVKSSVREAWDPTAYTFEFDEDEIRALLPRSRPAVHAPLSNQEPPQVKESPPTSEPAPSPPDAPAAQELSPEKADRPKLLQLPEEPQSQFEDLRKWRPEEAMKWLKQAMKDRPQKPDESKNAWAERLYEQMKRDFGTDIPWTESGTLRRRMNDLSMMDD
jgi:hypothetical protein